MVSGKFLTLYQKANNVFLRNWPTFLDVSILYAQTNSNNERMGWSCATRLIQTLELSSIIGTRPSQSLKLHPHNLLYIYYSHDRFAPLLHKV